MLSRGGSVNGFITRDGVNALPGVAVALFDSNGRSHAQAVSGSNGYFAMSPPPATTRSKERSTPRRPSLRSTPPSPSPPGGPPRAPPSLSAAPWASSQDTSTWARPSNPIQTGVPDPGLPALRLCPSPPPDPEHRHLGHSLHFYATPAAWRTAATRWGCARAPTRSTLTTPWSARPAE